MMPFPQIKHKGSVLVWVVVFTSFVILGYFYFSLTLRAALERQNSVVLRSEGDLELQNKLDQYTNPIPAGKTKINNPNFYIVITKFKSAIEGFLDAGYAREYHFMKNLDEAGDDGVSLLEKIDSIAVCWNGKNPSSLHATLLAWDAGNTVSNVNKTIMTATPSTPGSVCDGYNSGLVFQDVNTVLVDTTTDPDTKTYRDYLLYLDASEGGQYKIIAIGTTGNQVEIPDSTYEIYARWKGKDNINVDKFVRDRKVYQDGSIPNFPYSLYNFFCNDISYQEYRSC